MIKNKKGFTLIELLVAMSIISLIALAFFKIVSDSIVINSKNERDIKSMQIAQTQIENIRSQLKQEGKLKNLIIKYSNDTQGTIKEETISLQDNTSFNVDKKFEHITSDESKYTVQVLLTREKSNSNKYLYNIEVKVNTNLSKKETILNTSILDS